MITLLQEKKIKKYDILVIQELWQHYVEAKAYNFKRVDFTIINNEKCTYFYVN